jgi:hypothetical protein
MRVPLFVIAALLAAGCAAPGSTPDPAATQQDIPFDDLATTATSVAAGENGTRVLTFEGTAPKGAGALVAQRNVDPAPMGTFDVDARVGYAELGISYESMVESLAAVVLDEEGRILCAALQASATPTCTAPVPADQGTLTWSVALRYVLATEAPDTPVTVTVTLHPPSHITRGDPLAGIDRTIVFRESDTGVEGAEDNIGVLSDGAIFTQKNTNTMRSRDDGGSWEVVSPPGNDQASLDPMLFVDPWRGFVYVDHLYVGCSALSFSTDAGETWATNPAACGLPGDDHQKVASGPNPLPLVPLPAVYYSFSSFAQGAWASASYDGGVTFTPKPIVGANDGRQFSNTGPIYADEEGNVYVPYYMCDGDGYMGAGVSHDNGQTWKFVVASEQPGICYDPDAGLWSDIAGNVYLAYHRPDGVYYVASTDRGETWGAPVKVSPDTLLSFVHVDMVAGDEGRIAIVYRATPDTAKGPDGADGWAGWHLYVSFVENALGSAPVIRTGIVNDPMDPVQRGAVCTGGVGCFGGSRNLLDFIDIAVGPDGRVYPTYTDGCPEECPTPPDSRSQIGLVGVEVDGPRLFVDKAPWAS